MTTYPQEQDGSPVDVVIDPSLLGAVAQAFDGQHNDIPGRSAANTHPDSSVQVQEPAGIGLDDASTNVHLALAELVQRVIDGGGGEGVTQVDLIAQGVSESTITFQKLDGTTGTVDAGTLADGLTVLDIASAPAGRYVVADGALDTQDGSDGLFVSLGAEQSGARAVVAVVAAGYGYLIAPASDVDTSGGGTIKVDLALDEAVGFGSPINPDSDPLPFPAPGDVVIAFFTRNEDDEDRCDTLRLFTAASGSTTLVFDEDLLVPAHHSDLVVGNDPVFNDMGWERIISSPDGSTFYGYKPSGADQVARAAAATAQSTANTAITTANTAGGVAAGAADAAAAAGEAAATASDGVSTLATGLSTLDDEVEIISDGTALEVAAMLAVVDGVTASTPKKSQLRVVGPAGPEVINAGGWYAIQGLRVDAEDPESALIPPKVWQAPTDPENDVWTVYIDLADWRAFTVKHGPDGYWGWVARSGNDVVRIEDGGWQAVSTISVDTVLRGVFPGTLDPADSNAVLVPSNVTDFAHAGDEDVDLTSGANVEHRVLLIDTIKPDPENEGEWLDAPELQGVYGSDITAKFFRIRAHLTEDPSSALVRWRFVYNIAYVGQPTDQGEWYETRLGPQMQDGGFGFGGQEWHQALGPAGAARWNDQHVAAPGDTTITGDTTFVVLDPAGADGDMNLILSAGLVDGQPLDFFSRSDGFDEYSFAGATINPANVVPHQLGAWLQLRWNGTDNEWNVVTSSDFPVLRSTRLVEGDDTTVTFTIVTNGLGQATNLNVSNVNVIDTSTGRNVEGWFRSSQSEITFDVAPATGESFYVVAVGS